MLSEWQVVSVHLTSEEVVSKHGQIYHQEIWRKWNSNSLPMCVVLQIADKRRARGKHLEEQHEVEMARVLTQHQLARDNLSDRLARDIENGIVKEKLKVIWSEF